MVESLDHGKLHYDEWDYVGFQGWLLVEVSL